MYTCGEGQVQQERGNRQGNSVGAPVILSLPCFSAPFLITSFFLPSSLTSAPAPWPPVLLLPPLCPVLPSPLPCSIPCLCTLTPPPLSIQTVLLTFFLWTSCWVIYCISFLLSLSRNGKWDHRIITTSSKVWPHTSKNLSRQQTLRRINSSKRVVSRLCGIVTEYVISFNITFVCSVHCSQHT